LVSVIEKEAAEETAKMKAVTGKTLALGVGSDGHVSYDAVVKPKGSATYVHSSFTALVVSPHALSPIMERPHFPTLSRHT
jgi:hypothetical protein